MFIIVTMTQPNCNRFRGLTTCPLSLSLVYSPTVTYVVMGNSHAGLEQSNLSLWFEDVFGKKKKEKMSLLALIIML